MRKLLLRLFGARTIIEWRPPPPMSDRELDDAVSVPESHATYRAFMHLIDLFEAEAHEKAEADIYVPRALEAHTGGAKYLRELRKHILMRRERVQKQRLNRTPRKS